MQPSPTDVCSLYLNMATLAALPRRCARHNAPSHANFITKLVRSTCLGVDEYVVVSCGLYLKQIAGLVSAYLANFVPFFLIIDCMWKTGCSCICLCCGKSIPNLFTQNIEANKHTKWNCKRCCHNNVGNCQSRIYSCWWWERRECAASIRGWPPISWRNLFQRPHRGSYCRHTLQWNERKRLYKCKKYSAFLYL